MTVTKTKLMLVGTYMSVALVVGLAHMVSLTPFEWVMLALAALRMGRMIAYELIGEPLRRPVAVTLKHEHKGEYTDAKYQDGTWRQSLGELATCPTCASTWAAAVLLYGTIFLPGPAGVLIALFSAVQAGEIIGCLGEMLEWSAADARRRTGGK